MVTICTASLTFTNSTFCPHSIFMCFVWIWEQTAIISLYSINWLVFITEAESVYCAVRTGSLYVFQVTFRREVRVWYQPVYVGFVLDKEPVGLLLRPAVSTIPRKPRTHVRLNVTLTTSSTFRKSGSIGGTGVTVKLHEMLPLMFGNWQSVSTSSSSYFWCRFSQRSCPMMWRYVNRWISTFRRAVMLLSSMTSQKEVTSTAWCWGWIQHTPPIDGNYPSLRCEVA